MGEGGDGRTGKGSPQFYEVRGQPPLFGLALHDIFKEMLRKVFLDGFLIFSFFLFFFFLKGAEGMGREKGEGEWVMPVSKTWDRFFIKWWACFHSVDQEACVCMKKNGSKPKIYIYRRRKKEKIRWFFFEKVLIKCYTLDYFSQYVCCCCCCCCCCCLASAKD